MLSKVQEGLYLHKDRAEEICQYQPKKKCKCQEVINLSSLTHLVNKEVELARIRESNSKICI